VRTVIASLQPASSGSPAPSAAPSAVGGQPGSFAPVTNEPQTTSGETLLVAAYAIVWVAVMLFVALAWRRTRALEEKVGALEKALERTRAAASTPSTKRSPAGEEEA
jgi:hypothetical protein